MSSSSAPSFLDLPPELRQWVYRYLLLTKRAERAPIFTPSKPLGIHTEIIYTSRQISREARAILYRENTFVQIDTNSAQRSILHAMGLHCMTLQNSISGTGISFYPRPSLGVVLEYAEENTEDGPAHCFIIPAEDLATFCDLQYLFDRNGSSLTIHLRFYEPNDWRRQMSVKEQKTLLSQLIKRLWVWEGTTICAGKNVDTDVVKELHNAKNSNSTHSSAEVVVEKALLHRQEGDEAMFRGDFLQSGVKYNEGVITCYDLQRRFDQHHTLVSGTYNGYELLEVWEGLMFGFMVKLSYVYEEANQIEYAYNSADHAFSYIRQSAPSVSNAELVTLRLREAYLGLQLDDVEGTWHNLKEALNLDPENVAIKTDMDYFLFFVDDMNYPV